MAEREVHGNAEGTVNPGSNLDSLGLRQKAKKRKGIPDPGSAGILAKLAEERQGKISSPLIKPFVPLGTSEADQPGLGLIK